MENDLIRRSDVFTAATTPEKCDGYNLYPPSHGELLERIDNIPAVDAAEVVHGEWIHKNADGSWRVDTCSVCKKDTHYVRYAPPYECCPHCGARMDGEEEHNAAD